MKRPETYLRVASWGAVAFLAASCAAGAAATALGRDDWTRLEWIGIPGIAGVLYLFVAGYVRSFLKPRTEEDRRASFEVLADRAAASPDAFSRRLRRLTHLGEAYAGALLLLDALALVGILGLAIDSDVSGGVWGTFIVGVLAVAYIVLRALWIPKEEPEGLPLDPKEYPAVHALLARAVRTAGDPRIEAVSCLPDANCRVARVPLGFGLRSRTTLTVGLHLLALLDDPELEAVLHHELAHVVSRDVDTGRGLVRAVSRWSRIADACRPRGLMVQSLLAGFAAAYVEALEARAAAVSRERELLADAATVRSVPVGVFASALVKTALLGHFAARFAGVGPNDIRALPQPPKDYFTFFHRDFRAAAALHASAWQAALARRVSLRTDTHPSLAERLARLGADPLAPVEFPLGGRSTAAESGRIVATFDAHLHDKLEPNWQEIRDSYLRSLYATKAPPRPDAPDPGPALAYGLALEEIGRHDEALAFFENLLVRFPEHPAVLFRVGVLRLHRDDPAGIEPLQAALERSPLAAEDGLATLDGFLLANGLLDRREALRPWTGALRAKAALQRADLEEIHPADAFLPHGLDPQALERLREGLERNASVKQAFLVRKPLRNLPGTMLVLGVLPATRAPVDGRPVQALIDPLADHTFLFDIRSDGFRFTRPISNVPGSEIFRRVKAKK